MENKTKNVFTILLGIILVMGTAMPAVSIIDENQEKPMFERRDTEDTTVVLARVENDRELSLLDGYGEVIDHYGRNVLLTMDREEARRLEGELDIQILEDRNQINVKGHTFDTNEGFPELDSELKIEGYESGTEGIYLVDMIGPVNPEWREKIEEIGVNVFNYQRNYAYEVVMTPEKAEEVEDLDFVEWVGPYQPGFKLHPEINEALDKDMPLNIRLRPGFDASTLNMIEAEADILGVEDLREDGSRVTVDIGSIDDVEDLALENDVYYIAPYVEPELHAEMEAQMLGGGMWFMDDEYPTNTDLDPEPRQGDPQEPYRKYGDYGAYINQLGYSGEDLTVAVADTGIGDGTVGDAGVEDFTDRVIGGYGFGQEDDWADGHYHGTAVSGLVAGDTYRGSGETWDEFEDGDMEYYLGQGLSYESELFGTKIFSDGGDFIPTEYYPILEEPAQRSDAYIHTNSWGAGTLGEYFAHDEIFDQGVRDANRDTEENEPMVVTVSAGNDGGRGGFEQETGSPGNAKNVITIGGNRPYNPGLGHENPEEMYGASSRGWTEDNRVKPDVIAPSESVITHNTPLDDEYGDYIAAEGTSFGNPLVTGAATIIVDWYEENHEETPSPAMVRSILINTANELDPDIGDTRGHIPNRDEGWGVPDLSKLEYPKEDPIGFLLEDQETLIETGEVEEYEVNPDDIDEPLKVTLTWTDQNALEGDSSGGTPTLKNNLDLEVLTPEGEIIRGNAFDLSGDGESDDGYTYPDAEVMEEFDYNDDGWDDVNNVQNVFIHPDELESGIYTVRVHGTDIPEDANNDGEANQDFALTTYNVPDEIDIPDKEGQISFDREEYAGDDIVEITLSDITLEEEGSYDVTVSSYDSGGSLLENKTVELEEIGEGIFEGTVQLSEEDEDGSLWIDHDGEIKAWYLDEDPGPVEELESNVEDVNVNSPSDNIEEKRDVGVIEIIEPPEKVNSEEYHGVEVLVENFGDVNEENVPVETTIQEQAMLMREEFEDEIPEDWEIDGTLFEPKTWHHEGSYAYVEDDQNEDQEEWLISPEIDTSEVEETTLYIDQHFEDGSDGDPVGEVLISPDGGSTWDEIDTYTQTTGEKEYAITDQVEDEDEIQLAFVFDTEQHWSIGWTDYWEIYEIRISYMEEEYFDETTVDVDAGETTTAVFDHWNPSHEGEFSLESNTDLEADEDPTNDQETQDITVVDINDVGVIDIIEPPDVINSVEDQPIQVEVENFGTFDETDVSIETEIEEYSYLLDEDFADEIPEEWEIDDTSDETWYQSSSQATVDVTRDEVQEEWLITPMLDATDAEETLFEFNHHVSPTPANPEYTAEVLITSDGGDNWELIDQWEDGEEANGVYQYDISQHADGEDEVQVAFVWQSDDVDDHGSLCNWDISEVNVYYVVEDYMDSTTFDLDAGENKKVGFESWNPSHEGVFLLNSSTDLEGDDDPTNDYETKTITVEDIHDVGVTDIIEPPQFVNSLDDHPVEIKVENYGTFDETVPVEIVIEEEITLLYEEFEEEIPDEWEIDDSSEETWHWDDPISGTQATVDVTRDEVQEEWLITQPIDATNSEDTLLEFDHDIDPSSSDPEFTAEVKITTDGGETWELIDEWEDKDDPTGVYQYNISQYADGEDKVEIAFVWQSDDVEDHGTSCNWDIFEVNVHYMIEEYFDEATIDLDVEESEEIVFDDWNPSDEGEFIVNGTTDLEEDDDPTNDYETRIITVEDIYDVGVTDIISPEGVYFIDDIIDVEAEAENFGNLDQEDVPVEAIIEKIEYLLDVDLREKIPEDWTIESTAEEPYTWHWAEPWDGTPRAFVEEREDWQDEWLVTPEIDASDIEDTTLELDHNFDTSIVSGDSWGRIKVSADAGESWDMIEEWEPGESAEGVFEYDISDYADGNEEVQVAFVFNSSDAEEGTFDEWEIFEVNIHHMVDEYFDQTTVDLYVEEPAETVVFEDWDPTSGGDFRVEISTDLEGDEDPINDFEIEHVEILDWEHDYGVDEIISPEEDVFNETQPVEATVANYGDYDVEDLLVNATGSRISGLIEDFSGEFPPEGWETDDWTQSHSNNAGGEAPEANVNWGDAVDGSAYLESPMVNTTEADELILEFYSYIDDAEGGYNAEVLVRSSPDEEWEDVTPWNNPVDGDVGPAHYEVNITEHIGTGTQIQFYVDDDWEFNDWFVNDVRADFPSIEYEDETTVDIDEGESTTAEFEYWDPAAPGEYIFEVEAYHPEDINPDNASLDKGVHVDPIIIDLDQSFESPEEPIYDFDQEVIGEIENLGNYDLEDLLVEKTIDPIHQEFPIDEDFSEDPLSNGWSAEDWNNNDNTWEHYGENEVMKVTPEDDKLPENNVLWTPIRDYTFGEDRVLLEFYSSYAGSNDRSILLSTDGGETHTTIKRNIGSGHISLDITDWVYDEEDVIIGWEYYTEEIEENEFWELDDVEITEELFDEEYEDEKIIDEALEPGDKMHIQFDDWTPDVEDYPQVFRRTMTVLPSGNGHFSEFEISERINVYEYVSPEATNPDPFDGEEDVTHSPHLSVTLEGAPEISIDATFRLYDDEGELIAEENDTDILEGMDAEVQFMLLDGDETYQWNVTLDDGIETYESDTWEFHTYVPEPIWVTDTADINTEPPGQVENLNLDWDAPINEVEGNELTWDASPDDGSGYNDTEYYIIYRSDSEEGPWNEDSVIDTVEADGSENYTYIDSGRADDGYRWNYVVRAVDRVGNIELNEEVVSELHMPTATDPNPEDEDWVDELEQTLSVDVASPTGDHLNVEFYDGTTHEMMEKMTSVVNETVEYTWELKEENRTEDHHWYVITSYEDYNIGKMNPPEDHTLRIQEPVGVGDVYLEDEIVDTEEWPYTEEIEGFTEVTLEAEPGTIDDLEFEFKEWTGDVQENIAEDKEITLMMNEDRSVRPVFDILDVEYGWHWLYPDEHRTPSDVRIGGEDTWYGAMQLDLSEEVGMELSKVAYYNPAWDHETGAHEVQAHVSPNDDGAPEEPWAASTEIYEPEPYEGWVELELDEAVLIEDPGDYWVVLEFDDMGEGYFPAGAMSPHVENGGWRNAEDPFNADDWSEDYMEEWGFTFSIEAFVDIPEPEDQKDETHMADEDLIEDDDELDVAVVDAENYQEFEIEYKLEEYLPEDRFNVDTLWNEQDKHWEDWLIEEMGDYDTFVIQRFEYDEDDSKSAAEDFLDNLSPIQGVVYLDSHIGSTQEAYADGVRSLHEVRGDPEFRDSTRDGRSPQYLHILEDHEIFEGVGEEGDEVKMVELGTTNWGSWFDDYSGEILAEKDYRNDYKGPAVGVCEDRQEVLLSAKGIGFWATADADGWTEEANQLFANSVEFVSPPEELGWQFHLEGTEEPIANATVLEEEPHTIQDTITLDATNSYDPQGAQIINYTWTVEDPDGDETVLYGEKVNYTLQQPGDYNIVLEIKDPYGYTDTDSLHIQAVDTEPISVIDIVEDKPYQQGQTITLDGSNSYIEPGGEAEIENHSWMIEDPTGELTTLYGEQVEYTLEFALDYNITLAVEDSFGNQNTSWKQIHAVDTEDPIADAGNSDIARAGIEYKIDGTGSSDNVGIEFYNWTIEGISGDAEGYWDTTEGETVDYIFPDEGEYKVTLEVSDYEGNRDDDTITIIATPPLEAFEITHPEYDYQVIEKDTVTIEWEGHEYFEDMEYEVRINYGDWESVGTDTQYTFKGLLEGTHIVQVRATHETEETFIESRIFEIHTVEEELDITAPAGGVESLTYEEDFTIAGETDPELDVYINEVEVDVDEEGVFEYETTLVEGQNVFRVIAEHDGDKVAETTVYALYLPQIQEMQDDMDNLQNDIDENRDDINDLFNITDDLEIDIGELENELNGEVDRLEDALDENVTALEDALKENRTDLIDIIDDNITYIEGELEDIEDEIDDLWTAIDDINTTIGEMKDDIDKNREDIDELFNITDDLEIDIGELENELNAEVDRLEDALDENVTALEDAIKENRTDLIDIIDDNITYIEGELEDIEDEIDDLWTAIDDIDTTIGDMQDDINENREDIDELFDITDDLELDIIDLEHELQSEVSRLETELDENVTALEYAINDNADDISEAQDDIADIQDNIGEIEDELSNINTDIALIYDELEYLDGRIDGLEADLADEIDDLTTYVDNELTDLENDIDVLRSDMNDRIDDLEDEVEVDLGDLEENINARIDEVEDGIYLIYDELEYLEHRIDDLETDQENLEDNIEDLRNDMSDRIDDLEDKVEVDLGDLEENINARIDEVEDDLEKQIDDTNEAMSLAIVGIILAIIAILLGIFGLILIFMKKGSDRQPSQKRDKPLLDKKTEDSEIDGKS